MVVHPCISQFLAWSGGVLIFFWLGFAEVDGISFGLFGHECMRCPICPHTVHRGVDGS